MKQLLFGAWLCLSATSGWSQIQYGVFQPIHTDTLLEILEMHPVDMDADGDPDLVMRRSPGTAPGRDLVVCLNDGSGNFRVHHESTFPDLWQEFPSIQEMEIGDLDGDGDPDVLVVSNGSLTVPLRWLWYDNDGTGRLSLRTVIEPDDYDLEMDLLDLDDDGDPDVLTRGLEFGEIYWNRNNGAGVFALFDTIRLPADLGYYVFADSDGDGDRDIFNRFGNKFYWHESLGGADYAHHELALPQLWDPVSLADADGNGLADVLVTRNGNASCLYQTSPGQFELAAWSVGDGYFIGYEDVGFGDVTGDGLPEIIANNLSDSIIWYENLGTSFSDEAQLAGDNLPMGTGSLSSLTDVTADGRVDVLLLVQDEPWWLEQTDGQAFLPKQRLAGSDRVYNPLAVLDIDMDGEKDLVLNADVLSLPEDWMLIYRNDGQGQFSPDAEFRPFPAPYLALTKQLADVDGDLDPDLVAIRLEPDSSPDIIGDLVWLENQGNAQFGEARVIATGVDWLQLLIADLSGQGVSDIAVVRSVESDWFLHVYRNTGGGTFDAVGTATNLGSQTNSLFFADLNGDGLADLVQRYSFSEYRCFPGIGDGTFGEALPLFSLSPLGTSFVNTQFGDFNGDGLEDILVSYTNPVLWGDPDLEVAWYPNPGNASTWERILIQSTARDFMNNLIADPDSDGDADIVHIGIFDEAVGWFFNQGEGYFSDLELLIPDSGPFLSWLIQTTDLDGDGDEDLVVQYASQGLTGWFENLSGTGGRIICDIYYDLDGDKQRGPGEPGLGNQAVEILPEAVTVYSSGAGQTVFYGEEGSTYRVSWVPHPDWQLTTDSASFTVTLPAETAGVLAFGLEPTSPRHEVEIAMTAEPFICHADPGLTIGVRNTGTPLTSGILRVTFDDRSPVSVTPAPDSWNGPTAQWTFGDLVPGRKFTLQASLDLAPEMLGDTLFYNAEVILQEAGVPEDTLTSSYEDIVLCAYDPNDKLAQPPGVGEDRQALLGESLTYTIRFQNTGNFPAQEVIIIDTLDAGLDLNTFRVLGSSHAVQTSLQTASRAVTFRFPDIMLPDSTSNPAGSNGYVTYRITPLESLSPKTLVQNTAYILFDANPAIATNTVFHSLVESIGNGVPSAVIETPQGTLEAYVYPNPVGERAYFVLEGDADFRYHLSLTDLSGRELRAWPDQQTREVALSFGGIPSGIYLLAIRNAQGTLLGSVKIIR